MLARVHFSFFFLDGDQLRGQRERKRESCFFLYPLPSSTPPRTIDNEVRLHLMVPGEAHNVIYVVCVGPRFHVISFRFECLVELVES